MISRFKLWWFKRKLLKGNLHQRIDAAKALGALGDTRAVPFLHLALHDDSKVRDAAFEALSRLRAVDELLVVLNKHGHLVSQGAQALAGLGAIEHLWAALANSEGLGRTKAAEELGKLGDARSVRPLCEVLTDRDSTVRSAAIRALEALGDKQVVEPLLPALKDSNAEVRMATAKALGTLGDARVVEPLLAAVQHDREGFHYSDWRAHEHFLNAAVGALVKIGIVKPLLTAISAGAESVRYGAAKALLALGWTPANTEQRIAIAIALRQYDQCVAEGEVVLAPLLAAAKDGVNTMLLASKVISELPEIRDPAPLLAALKGNQAEIRRIAAHGLAKAQDRRAVEALLAALEDSVATVRRSALGSLAVLSVVEPVLAAIKDNDEQVRVDAAFWLGAFKNEVRVVGPLVGALKDESASVRLEAVKALSRIGDVKPLLIALRERSAKIREIAAQSLAVLGWRPASAEERVALAIAMRKIDQCMLEGSVAVEPLLAMLGDNEKEINWDLLTEVIVALGKLGLPRPLPALLVVATSKKTVADVAIEAVRRILGAASGEVCTEALHAIIEMKSVVGLQYFHNECGGSYGDSPVDCSQVKQLARQELIRRGLKA